MTEHSVTPVVYCYSGQNKDVRKFFGHMGGAPSSLALVEVETAEQMAKQMLPGSVFFHVKDHLDAIHEELWAVLAARKAVVVEIDNSRVPI